MTSDSSRLPALFLGHGAPHLLEDPVWPNELAGLAAVLPRPKSILVISAHWESAPLTIGATRTLPLIYDFYGFPKHYYDVTYPAPGAPELAESVSRLVSDLTPTVHAPTRGLDHGAYMPLLCMYPAADVPVLQISIPTEHPVGLFEVGRRLAPLRDEGVLLVGSGFLTHSFAAMHHLMPGPSAPPPILEFDAWAAETVARRDVDALLDYHTTAPALNYAHPTQDHFVPLFIALGAGYETSGGAADTPIEGFWRANSKRSFEFS